ncbi:MAG: RusA family crossover junction endodeoxyribonuclease [Gammaproteobacteria bacterium]|nr:RusA family crossover junction endodeoxyribonuclease [Gammaproteobacteria bacterium]
MHDYEFDLPWPPSVNGYWRTFRNRQIISERGRDYRQSAFKEMQRIGLFNEMISDRLKVSLTLHPPTLRKYDIDNFCKATFDALSHARFWEDDEQIDKLSINKGEKIKEGKITIKITKI